MLASGRPVHNEKRKVHKYVLLASNSRHRATEAESILRLMYKTARVPHPEGIAHKRTLQLIWQKKLC